MHIASLHTRNYALCAYFCPYLALTVNCMPTYMCKLSVASHLLRKWFSVSYQLEAFSRIVSKKIQVANRQSFIPVLIITVFYASVSSPYEEKGVCLPYEEEKGVCVCQWGGGGGGVIDTLHSTCS